VDRRVGCHLARLPADLRHGEDAGAALDRPGRPRLPLAWLGAETLELDGLALALALTTVLVCIALLRELGVLADSGPALLAAALTIAAIAAVCFAAPSLFLGSVATAVVGLVAYVVVLAVIRPRGLSSGWQYLRALG
jgi:hypothetical protein